MPAVKEKVTADILTAANVIVEEPDARTPIARTEGNEANAGVKVTVALEPETV